MAQQPPKDVPPAVGYYGLNLGTEGGSIADNPNAAVSADDVQKAVSGIAGGTGAAAGGAAGAGSGGGMAAASQAGTATMGDSSAGGDDMSGVAGGAATGAAVGGPWGAVIGAAAGLLRQVAAQKAATAAAKQKYLEDQKAFAQKQVADNQQGMVRDAGEYGNNEQSALARMMSMFNATKR